MHKIDRFDKFNEAIVKPEKGNIIAFLKEIDNGRNQDTFKDLIPIADKYDIDIVDYKTFYNGLTKEQQKKAPPPQGTPIFGYVNPTNNKPTIVYQVPKINPQLAEMLRHYLEHEMVHHGQVNNRINTTGFMKTDVDVDPKKLKEYFADSDEQMAFSQSISDLLINRFKCKSMKEAIYKLDEIQLWNDIKKNVDIKIQNKYKKYIFQYLEEHFKDKEEKKPMSDKNSTKINRYK